MAGDWIKMRADLFTHPKVVRISSAMKADTLRTVGGLMSVWCLFDAHSEDGQLEGYSFEVVDELLRWSGFSKAMAGVGWLEETPDGLALPRFDAHNGQSSKRRAQDADRKREVRKVSAPEADKKRTREEKRREDISPTNVGESAKRATRKCPSDFVVTDEMRNWAAENFPAVDLDAAAAKFRDHTFTKSITDWPATLRNWVRKEAEFAPTRKPVVAFTSFAQQDELARRARWEEMTGRKWPTDGDVIDMENPQQRISA